MTRRGGRAKRVTGEHHQVDDALASGADDSHPIRLHLNGLIARIADVAHRHGNMGVLDLIGTVQDPEHSEAPVKPL
jgi:hypothetical protein